VPVAEEGGQGEETKPSVDKSKERLYRVPFHKAKTSLAKTGVGIYMPLDRVICMQRGGGGGRLRRQAGKV
jgi:hypothetical protein